MMDLKKDFSLSLERQERKLKLEEDVQEIRITDDEKKEAGSSDDYNL